MVGNALEGQYGTIRDLYETHLEDLRSCEVAERVGFEPTVPETGTNGFRDRRLQPLGHLSTALPILRARWVLGKARDAAYRWLLFG